MSTNIEVFSDDNGCQVRTEDVPNPHEIDHLWVRYGLPATSKNPNSPNDPDTLEGALRAAIADEGVDCSVSEGTEEIEAVHNDKIVGIRERLDENGHVRRYATRLSQIEVNEAQSFRKLIEKWLETCEDLADSSSGTEGAGTGATTGP